MTRTIFVTGLLIALVAIALVPSASAADVSLESSCNGRHIDVPAGSSCSGVYYTHDFMCVGFYVVDSNGHAWCNGNPV